jgi:hypothetical protein
MVMEDTFHQHNVGVTFGECGEDGPAVRGPGDSAGDDGAALAEVGDLAQISSLCGNVAACALAYAAVLFSETSKPQ